MNKEKVKRLKQLLEAMSEPSRLEIMILLSGVNNPLTPSIITTQVGISAPTVSGHLRILNREELITYEKVAQSRLYTVNYSTIKDLKFLLEDAFPQENDPREEKIDAKVQV